MLYRNGAVYDNNYHTKASLLYLECVFEPNHLKRVMCRDLQEVLYSQIFLSAIDWYLFSDSGA